MARMRYVKMLNTGDLCRVYCSVLSTFMVSVQFFYLLLIYFTLSQCRRPYHCISHALHWQMEAGCFVEKNREKLNWGNFFTSLTNQQHTVINVAYTGWSKKRGHSTFSQISRKLLKISKWFFAHIKASVCRTCHIHTNFSN